MKNRTLRALGVAALGLCAAGAFAQTVVGVSWSNFQEERW
jgi:D-xylose transport system substrate-binding protein